MSHPSPATCGQMIRARLVRIATATPRRRFVVHNVLAHPLLVLWPRAGNALHNLTAPE